MSNHQISIRVKSDLRDALTVHNNRGGNITILISKLLYEYFGMNIPEDTADKIDKTKALDTGPTKPLDTAPIVTKIPGYSANISTCPHCRCPHMELTVYGVPSDAAKPGNLAHLPHCYCPTTSRRINISQTAPHPSPGTPPFKSKSTWDT